jgi:hypothetical protein
MSFTEVGGEFTTNGTTPVTVVPTPSSGHRHLLNNVHIDNTDTITRTASIFKDKGGTPRRIGFATIITGAQYTFTKVTVLDATNESIYVVMGEADTTAAPTVDVAYADVTP